MPIRFGYHDTVRQDFPQLVVGLAMVDGVDHLAADPAALARYTAMADARLSEASEGAFPEIQAWRRAFAQMGLKPTQYRSAAEALLRRYKKDRSLPPLHPLVDLCNALSLGFAIPIAVIDRDRVAWPLTVRPAEGDETYLSFGGEVETPKPGEIVFADADRQVHARRWTNRQSARSAMSPATRTALIVAEALHPEAGDDVTRLLAALEAEVQARGGQVTVTRAVVGPMAEITL